MAVSRQERKDYWLGQAVKWGDSELHPIVRQGGKNTANLLNDIARFGRELEGVRMRGGKLLDLAAGGGLEVYFPEVALPETTAVDWSWQVLDMNNAEHKVEADLDEAFPFRNSSFDFVTMFFGTRYIEKIPSILSEIYRVLKNGGRFLVVDYTSLYSPMIELSEFDPNKLMQSSLGKIGFSQVESQLLIQGKRYRRGEMYYLTGLKE